MLPNIFHLRTVLELKRNVFVKIALMQLLVMYYDNKMVKSPGFLS